MSPVPQVGMAGHLPVLTSLVCRVSCPAGRYDGPSSWADESCVSCLLSRRSVWRAIFLGQLLSVLNMCTGVTSQLLTENYDVSIPTG